MLPAQKIQPRPAVRQPDNRNGQMSHYIVELRYVFFNYPDGTETLRGISFRITHGESVGIVGANGAGKSTLLLQMNGYLRPSGGTITIGDLQLSRQNRKEIRKK